VTEPGAQLLEVLRRQPDLARAHPILWALYASQGKWVCARHLKFLADACMRLVRGEIRRLIVSMPPRHGKTAFIWRYFAAWWLANHPDKNVITCTYQEKQAKRWSKQMRDDLHNFGRDVFGVWAAKRAGAGEWAALFPDARPAGGLLTAVGSGGALTGKGCDLLVLDDPVKGIKEVRSPAIREAAWDWFDADLLTRLEPDGLAVIVMTRWHEDDVVGRILRAQEAGDPPGGEPWEVINLPALAEEGDALGRSPGESLWPERGWTPAKLSRMKAGMDPYTWAALFEGRPTPGEGGSFKAEWVRHYQPGETAARVEGVGQLIYERMIRFATIDLAASMKTSADWTVVASWAYCAHTDKLLLLDLLRVRAEGPDILPLIHQQVNRWKLGTVWIERVAWQLFFIQQAQRELPVRELVPDRDKFARALPATAAMSSGRVLLPAGAHWLQEFVRELLLFGPAADHDDQVDCLSYAVMIADSIRTEHVRGVGYDVGPGDESGWWDGRRAPGW
jgi:predicted phage terminase large subunit-like protein